VTALADEIRDHPMLLTSLDRFQRQCEPLSTAQSAPDQHRSSSS
jgi:hypothetical protein